MLVTLPLGYNPDMDALLARDAIPFTHALLPAAARLVPVGGGPLGGDRRLALRRGVAGRGGW